MKAEPYAIDILDRTASRVLWGRADKSVVAEYTGVETPSACIECY